MAKEDELSGEEPAWTVFIERAVEDLARTRVLKESWFPLRDYIQSVIERLSFLLTCLVGLQVFLTIVILGDFLLNLRSVFVLAP